MSRLLGCGLCLALSACVNLMPANMKPVAIKIAGNSSRFVGDTLILTVVNRSTTPSVNDEVRFALAGTLRSAFPAAVVLESGVDTTPAPRRLFVATTLVEYGPSWKDSRWIGHTGIDVFVHDRRESPGHRFVDLIRTSTASGIVHMGNKTIGDVSRASFDSATRILIAFLESLDDPNTRDKLASKSGVSEIEYAPFLEQAGNSSLQGRAFIRDGGTEHPAVGQPVTLDAATTSARRWYDRFGMVCGAFDSSASPDDLFLRTRRQTITDVHGSFDFADLAAGTYFVRTRVLWDAPEPTDGLHKITQQYAFVSSAVTIAQSERKEITLNETDNAYLRCPSPMRGRGGRPKPGFLY